MRTYHANLGIIIDLVADIGEDDLASTATARDLLVAIGIIAIAIIVWGDQRILAYAVGRWILNDSLFIGMPYIFLSLDNSLPTRLKLI